MERPLIDNLASASKMLRNILIATIEKAHVDSDEIQRFQIRKFKVLLGIDVSGMEEFMAQKSAELESESSMTDNLKLAYGEASREHRAGKNRLWYLSMRSCLLFLSLTGENEQFRIPELRGDTMVIFLQRTTETCIFRCSFQHHSRSGKSQ